MNRCAGTNRQPARPGSAWLHLEGKRSSRIRDRTSHRILRGRVIHMTSHSEKGLSMRRKRLTLAATIIGSSMAFIDGSVVNVALPAIQHALNADAAATQWIVNAYLLLLGSLVLIGGAAADLYGRRRIFVLGLAAFTIASIGCAFSPNITVLILSRALQGLGAALLTPASLAML